MVPARPSSRPKKAVGRLFLRAFLSSLGMASEAEATVWPRAAKRSGRNDVMNENKYYA
jgi:hypothetical protein